MKGLYKNIGNYDTTNLINIVSNQTENDWNKHRFRQETYPVHSSTTTLPILFDEQYSRNVGTKSEWYSIYEDEILKIEKQIQQNHKLKTERQQQHHADECINSGYIRRFP